MTATDHGTGPALRLPDTLSLMLDEIRLSGAEIVDLALVPDTVVTFARPNRAVIYIVIEGEAWFELDDAPQLHLREKDLIVVTTGQSQRLSCTPQFAGGRHFDIGETLELRARGITPDAAPPQTEPDLPPVPTTHVACGVFRYDADFARPLIAALPALIRFAGTGAGAPIWLAIGLAFLAQERQSPRPAQQAVINRLIDILMIECLRDQIDRLQPDARNWLGALQDPHISPALAAIHQDPARDWSVPDLAGFANLSRSAFATRFSTRLGQSPMAYITSHRLRIAARQLRQAALPVKTIAANLGYKSTVGFNQAFRKEFGYPPSTLRRDKD